MIDLSAEALSVLTHSHRRYARAESWLAGRRLADNIPLPSAAEEVDTTLPVPERVTLTVPRTDRGTDWSPTSDDHPLAASGQRLRVQLGIEVGGGRIEWIQRGWYLIQDSGVDGDAVSVTVVGLTALISEARLVSPYQPTGTFVSTLRGLVEPALTVRVDGSLADRSVPSGINWDEDRLAGVYELLDAWPATARVTPGGYLQVSPATTPASVLDLTDGAGGTVIRATGSTTRDGVCNVVVARGTASDGGQIQGVAYASSGPTRAGGPFNPLPVPFYYYSPLLTTVPQCVAAAQSMLARKQREAGRAYRVEMVPHPGLQDGDVVRLTTDEIRGRLCSVEALTLPWTVADGAQTLTVRELP